MPSAKRERQREGRELRMAAARAQQQRRQRWRTVRNFLILIAAIVIFILALSWWSGDDSEPSTSSASSSSSSAPIPVPVTMPSAGATLTGDTPCPAADGSAGRATNFEKEPPMCIDPAKTYTAVVDTSKGSFTIALDAAKAPKNVNNFVVLSRYHYYDNMAFHRVIPSFVNQIGDLGPSSPGYAIADELPTDSADPYSIGAVAIANDGGRPNTGDTQWFIVMGVGPGLELKYSKLGTISSGLDVARAINAVGTNSGIPTEEVLVRKVTINEA